MSGQARKTREAEASMAVSGIDWNAKPALDPERIETGNYKFSGSADNRMRERISHRELGFVSMSLRVPGGRWLPVRLWDFTSISFGVVHEREPQAWPRPAGASADRESAVGPETLPLRPGDEVEVRICLSPGNEFETWCQVRNLVPVRDGMRIGLRRLDVNFPQAVAVERREAYRLPLAPALSLKARIAHPFLFPHWSPLVVSDINRDMGLSFVCEDPSVLLFEGMEIRVHFEIARHRDTPMIARVVWVHAAEADRVKFGVACADMPWALHNALCDYLLYSRHWTPERLRGAGFLARQVRNRLRFRSVRTMDDYAAVLYLRRDAYVGAGKKPGETRPEEMASRLDGKSRILMAWHLDALVGSLTFAFPSGEGDVLDSQTGFPGGKYPVPIPPKEKLIEVSRLCIDADYRGTDLLQGLFEHGAKHFLLSDREWLLTSATSELLPLYERIGFRKLKASYRHPALNHLEHHLILAHRDAFLVGRGVHPFVWATLFGDLVRHLLDRRLIDPGPSAAFLIRSKLLLAPLAKRLLARRSRRAFRRHFEALRSRSARRRTDRLPDVRAGGLQAEDFLPAGEPDLSPD